MRAILYLITYITACFCFAGCTLEQHETDIIPFDVSVSYPEKEITLEEVADIEYLQLALDDNFLFRTAPDAVTKDKIIFGLFREGDVLVFSRNGKPLSKFNHKGDGPENYVSIRRVLYDETPGEFFVCSRNKIAVYDTSGTFRRTIPLPEGASIVDITNFDSGTLLIYDDSDVYPGLFCLISKEDGHVVEVITIPEATKEADLTTVTHQDMNGVTNYYYPPAYHIVSYKDGYLLTNYSVDTVYFLSAGKKLSPVLVRKPDMLSMEPMISLNGFVEAGNYEFLFTVKYKADNGRLPKTYLMRDKKTGAIYRQKISFSSYKGKEVMLSPETIANTKDGKVGLIVLNLEELKQATAENRLSGTLKQLTERSGEEGNDIFMFLHFK
jgi:hypothetical protein